MQSFLFWKLHIHDVFFTGDGPDGDYFLTVFSEETVNLCRPLALLDLSTLLPLAVDILFLKPCLFLLFLREGWNVLFIALALYKFLLYFVICKRSAKIGSFFLFTNHPLFLFLINYYLSP